MQFRTKARAVDLLGKGQIADLPTAITELWKNGYDAYADNLTAEIYLDTFRDIDNPLFVITDDGKGMSRNDIFEKWLVLGTDSKSRAKLEDKESEETLWKKPRIKAGEKGIGRLSVAFLGNPMLMLSKKQGHTLQALFFDWRLLENYNLFLDDVDLPIEEIENNSDFPVKFENLKRAFLENFEKENDLDGNLIWEDNQSWLKTMIKNSVDSAKIPAFLSEKLLADLLDIENDHGTKFVVFEPIDQIVDLTNSDEDGLVDKEFVISSLSGFTNDFKKNSKIVRTSIPVFKEENFEYDFLTSQGNFFTAEDYELADIIIDGDLDGKGEFKGKIKIYDEVIDYANLNPRRNDSRNYYGKVPLKIGYSQGNEVDSKLEDLAYKKINQKVKEYGGLYIYRDNFRVLPYGRPNADFLNIEERRNTRIGTYFFSYRRMFGYIDISRERNSDLKDKSSREGLINNSKYRAFKSDLESLFVDLAKTYFSDKAKQSIFLEKKAELNEQAQAIKKDNKRAIEEKKAFTRSLKNYPEKFESYQIEYKSILEQLEEKTVESNILYSDIEYLLDKLHTLDIEFKNLIPKVPKRYKPTDTQLDRLNNYENKLLKFNATIKNDSAQLMAKVKDRLEVKELKMEFTKNYQKYNGILEKTITENRTKLKGQFDNLLKDFSSRSRRIMDELNFEKEKIVNAIDSKESVFIQSEKLGAKFEFLREQINKELSPLVEHLSKLSFDIDEELVQGAYKAEYETIKYKWEQTRETAQLGVAVEIIDHEFNQLYAKINGSLEKLTNGNLFADEEQFQFLTQNFKQLENKYELLSPLYRVAGVISKEISGDNIYHYLLRFFDRRIEDYNIELNSTEKFDKYIFNIKEPVIHTVFINIINNAIYWMRNVQNRKILLDYKIDTDEILICNSGLKIEEHRLEKIFDMFYSNRPNGRGIGLYLSKQSLYESNLDLYATNKIEYNLLNGACFVIRKII
ncbi:Histidine kinase-, DNA gyrase B-, and HSP90-like ATPase [Pricia antarctica]|uniref:Histidine kinase-, DNA gyrase B-, and HSP90-like ATPase n=1 Tax=Pricia antarctica TaxID=641691 RepID=A0A1G7BUJ5_9FLAO|nr:ATP-binding protein [Pricia antarctica]SDE30749.1 Histidine kinase-, DNA gyrase B-, and HSP90-like ATPase [Pricia antarctica]